MMNRINTFLFLTVLTATISVISMASAEAQEIITWFGETYLPDSDSADGSLTVLGDLSSGEFSITSARLHGATLRCRKSHVDVDMTQEPSDEYTYTVVVNERTDLLVLQAVGKDGNTLYAVSGRINSADHNSLWATVTVARSQVFFSGHNDAKVELCTARLKVRAYQVVE